MDTGVKARRLYTPHRRCRPVPGQRALPLDSNKGLAALCTPADEAGVHLKSGSHLFHRFRIHFPPIGVTVWMRSR